MAKKEALTTLENSYKQLIEMGFSADEISEIFSGDKKTLKPISKEEAIDAIVLYFKVKKILSDKVIKGYLEKVKETDSALITSRNTEVLKTFEDYARQLENSIVITNVGSEKKEYIRSWENYFTDKIAEQEKILKKSMNDADRKVAEFKKLLENPFDSQFANYIEKYMDEKISSDIAYAINNDPSTLETVRGLKLLIGRQSQTSYTDVVLEGVYNGTKVHRLLNSNEALREQVENLKKELKAQNDVKAVLTAGIAGVFTDLGLEPSEIASLLESIKEEVADNSAEIEAIREDLVGIIDTSLEDVNTKLDEIGKKSNNGIIGAVLGAVVPTIAAVVLGIMLGRANDQIANLKLSNEELNTLKSYILNEQKELVEFNKLFEDLKIGELTQDEIKTLEKKILAFEATDKINNPSSTAYMRLLLDYAKLQQNEKPQTVDYLVVLQDFAKVISELEVALADNNLTPEEKTSIQNSIDLIKAQSDDAVKTLANEYGVDIENILKSFETPSSSENEYAKVKEFYDLYAQVLAGNATVSDMQTKLDENKTAIDSDSKAISMMTDMILSAENIFGKVIYERETAELEEFMELYNKVITNSDGKTLSDLELAIMNYDSNSTNGQYSSTPIMNAFKAAAEEYLSADETPVVENVAEKFYENYFKKYLAGEIDLQTLKNSKATLADDVVIDAMIQAAENYEYQKEQHEYQKKQNDIYKVETKELQDFLSLYSLYLKGSKNLQDLQAAQEAAKQNDSIVDYSSTPAIEKIYAAAEIYENLINKVEQITGETDDIYEALDEIIEEINKLIQSGAEIDNATVMDVLAYYAKEVARINGLYDELFINYNKVSKEYNEKIDEYEELNKLYQEALDNSADEKTIADLKKQLAEKESELAELQTEYNEALNEITQKDSTIADLQKQITDKETELNSLRAEHQGALNELSQKNSTIADLQNQLESKEDEISKLEEQLEAALDNSADEATIADLQNQLAEKLTELANLEKLYEEALDNSEDEAKIADLQNQLAEKLTELANLEKLYEAALDNSVDEAKIADLQNQLAEKLTELANLEKLYEEALDNSEDEVKIADLQNQLTEKEIELANLEKLYKAALDNSADEAKIADLQEKLNAKNNEISNLNKKLAASESTIESLEKQVDDKLEEINAIKSSLDSSIEQINALGEKVAELEAKLQELSQTSEGMIVLRSLYEKLYGVSPDGLTNDEIIAAISNDFDLEFNQSSSGGLGME